MRSAAHYVISSRHVESTEGVHVRGFFNVRPRSEGGEGLGPFARRRAGGVGECPFSRRRRGGRDERCGAETGLDWRIPVLLSKTLRKNQKHGDVTPLRFYSKKIASLRKKFFPQTLTRLDLGALYTTDADDIRYCMKAKKSVELSDDGLLSLDFKGACSVSASRKPLRADFTGCAELSRKVFNFTEDQDLKLKIGYNAKDKVVYAQVRENNWTLNMDVNGRWGIRYDL
ncbi:hypothetical protein CYMTET_10101 [Cymbomonas tetramitiformis]|uniref:Uncharacterized protein n=1 Tax=Cymbomonas tetramitiformis TaxID=36881 RepID=A0AAE0GQ82_9CHLO|nr:hypothetical protein CYMTET_10101 [Cymbomonas tetramitiformis]